MNWLSCHPGVLLDHASMFYEGNQVAYAYPVGILQASKNLVYNDGGTEIYR